MNRGWKFGLIATLLGSAAPVLAGDEPLYQSAPEWVEVVPQDQLTFTPGKSYVLLDNQTRLDLGKVWNYSDVVYQISTPTDLTSAGTLSAGWLPDKGDLLIHRAEIIRGGEVIDILAQGSRFTVLRREEMLERRQLDGVLTATMPVPGLRIGDSVRLAYTTVRSDQALKDKVQFAHFLMSGEVPVEWARLKVSWPEKEPFTWAAGPDAPSLDVVSEGGYSSLEVYLPLAERAEVPADAPVRFRRPQLLQVGNFSSWEDVSSSLGAYYQTAGLIAPDGEIMAHVKRIMRATSDPVERAAMALQVVQDDISYLANGLDGGNYLPQKPEETWKLRYGDCKAKSLLLVAMLRELGIQADTVAVHSSLGDAVPEQLPLPLAFDHVIAHAVIDGTDYWLDGTSIGGRLSSIRDVPDFHYALPLTPQGSGLVKMVERLPTSPNRLVTVMLDQSAGIDLPPLFEVKAQFFGPQAAGMQPLVSQANDAAKKDFANNFAKAVFADSQALTYDFAYDAKAARMDIALTGIAPPFAAQWNFERGLATMAVPALEVGEFAFNPDRARAAWKQYPVMMPGSGQVITELEVRLPDEGKGYKLRGSQQVDTQIAGVGIVRSAAIEGDRVKVREQVTYSQQEVAAEAISAEKGKAARFSAGSLTIAAPRDVKRNWDFTTADKARLAPLEEAYAKLIADDPEDTSALYLRGLFRAGVLNWDGALADLAEVNEIRPTAAGYLTRGNIYSQLGKWDEALAEIRQAFDIEPTPDNAIAEASLLAEMGQHDEALGLLEPYENDAQMRQAVLMAKADILGQAGRAPEGLAVIEELQLERPGDPALLNASCWIMGIWETGGETMLPTCTKAVESAGWSPPVLDSRAMAYFRLGRMDDALADLDAALLSAPDLAPTLYMRGIVRTTKGDANGSEDIESALRRMPSIGEQYARYGIKPTV